MSLFPVRGRTVALVAVIVPVLAVFIYVALRSGPLAPVAVKTTRVASLSIEPDLFGIGTVQSRYTHKIGPVNAGRIKTLNVDVGDIVKSGQVLGQMDPVDLEDRLRSQEASIGRAKAWLTEAKARQEFALTQQTRYQELFKVKSASEEILATKRQELHIAEAALQAAQQDLAKAQADLDGLKTQQANLVLVSPVNGLVVSRDADPGTTVVAGQAVIEIIDPQAVWIHARFDQMGAAGLKAGLPSQIVLRSRQQQSLSGRVLRLEPIADQITEETLAKIAFDSTPIPLPPIGEIVEITVKLSGLPEAPVIPNAAVRSLAGKQVVWKNSSEGLQAVPVKLGASDLSGNMQVLEGLKAGDEIVLYSEKTLTANTRINVVEQIKTGAR